MKSNDGTMKWTDEILSYREATFEEWLYKFNLMLEISIKTTVTHHDKYLRALYEAGASPGLAFQDFLEREGVFSQIERERGMRRGVPNW